MQVKRIVLKKEMKLLGLLLSSLLIASASAAVYYSMEMRSNVTTATPFVKFVAGTDSTEAGASDYATDGTYVRLAGLKAYPNATLTYDQAIKIKNTDAATHKFRLTHVTINNDTDTSNFYSIVFKLIAANGTQYGGGDFTYDNSDGNDTWDPPYQTTLVYILGSEEFAVKVVTRAASGATADVKANVVISVDTQS